MSPRNVVAQAKRVGLDVIGICDHNTCENVPYVKKSAADEDLDVLGGFEVTSREEVHLLAFFDNEEALYTMQRIIYRNLHGSNDERLYGNQVVVNERDEVVKFNERLLIGATELPIEGIVNSIHELHGLAIASHVDRKSFSILSQLGFVPPDVHVDALEVSTKDRIEEFRDLPFPLVSFSDAHSLDSIGRNLTLFSMREVSLEEMRMSLLGEDGRKAMV
jgi:PHP family Zn ribbon phosphoesterase